MPGGARSRYSLSCTGNAIPEPCERGTVETKLTGNWCRIGTERVTGGLVAAGAGTYLAVKLRDGWIPTDDGSMAQSAERILLGELPHRDFGELYTGGLSYVHAWAFRLLGIDMFVLRLVLLLAFVLWVYVLYGVARHFIPRGMAIFTVALGVAWSVPNYPGPIPSWYNMFLATASLYALLSFAGSGRIRWLVLAGAAAGLSTSVKIVGLYLVAASVFYLLYHEQSAQSDSASPGDQTVYGAFLTFAVVTGLVGPVALVAPSGSAANWVHFILPLAFVGLVLLAQERRTENIASSVRFRALISLATPYAIGVAIPLLALVLYFAANGAATDLFFGVFIRPASRLRLAAQPAFPVISMLPTLMLFALVWTAALSPRQCRELAVALQLVLFATLLALAPGQPILFTASWISVFHVPPLIIAIGCIWLLRAGAASPVRRRMFLLLSTTAFVSLNPYPFAGALHFYPTVPFVVLTVAALLVHLFDRRSVVRAATVPAAFFLSFAVLLLNHVEWATEDPGMRRVTFDQARADLRVPRADSMRYNHLLAALDSLGDRRLGYAGPDAPEVYFLYATPNPNPQLFDFLYPEQGTAAWVLSSVADSDVVVLKTGSGFSADHFFASDSGKFEQRFPRSVEIDGFTIRWRD